MWRHSLRLPVFIVIAVLHPFVPEFDLAFEIFRVRVGERSHFEEESVAVAGPVIEPRPTLLLRPFARASEAGEEVERMRQEERAIVVHVVAEPVVVHWRL